jgi:Flp pilus assembly protein TadG
MRSPQRGVTTVEFAIVGTVLFTLLFGVIEFGRALFVANALAESTRRGARMAAGCPVGDPTTANVEVSYLDQAGATLANPAGSFASIRYVRVRIVNFTQEMMIPFVMPELLMPPFTAILPIESLGYSPTQQAFLACTAV